MEGKMTKIKFEFEVDTEILGIAPSLKDPRTQRFMEDLWTGLKQITNLELVGGWTFDAWMRTCRDNIGVHCEDRYDPDTREEDRGDEDGESSDKDSEEDGWWIFNLCMYCRAEFDGLQEDTQIDFFSGDFANNGEKAKEKLMRFFGYVQEYCELPTVSSEGMVQAIRLMFPCKS